MTENQRIKILRKEAGLSQVDLALSMGLDQSAISSIESGKNKVTKNFKILLSHILKVRLEFIETGEGEKIYAEQTNNRIDENLKDQIIKDLRDRVEELKKDKARLQDKVDEYEGKTKSRTA